MQQCMQLTAYDTQATTNSLKLRRLRHENVVLCSCTLSPLDQNSERKVAYHRLSEAEHGWNYNR
jgi:hypothetical protein